MPCTPGAAACRSSRASCTRRSGWRRRRLDSFESPRPAWMHVGLRLPLAKGRRMSSTVIATAHLQAREARHAQDIRVGKHAIVADEPEAHGGADAGPAPYDLLLSALGACTSITLRMYAEKKGWDVGAVSVSLRFVKEGDADRIERALRFSRELSEEQRS